MKNCSVCGFEIILLQGEQVNTYTGGKLIVTDFPSSQCQCETTINLSDGIIADLYTKELELREIRGDVVISLNDMKHKYKSGEIIDHIYAQSEKKKNIDWMKEKLSISTNEQLYSEALALLYSSLVCSKTTRIVDKTQEEIIAERRRVRKEMLDKLPKRD
jgi:hypothetical protein